MTRLLILAPARVGAQGFAPGVIAEGVAPEEAAALIAAGQARDIDSPERRAAPHEQRQAEPEGKPAAGARRPRRARKG